MFLQLSHLQKLFLIQFFLFGSIYATSMCLVDLAGCSGYRFAFNFLFFGGLMAAMMVSLEKRSLNKQGVFELNAKTMNPNQQREVTTSLSKEQFYEFWNASSKYNATQNDDGSLTVVKKYYTSEFKASINVSYQDGSSPKMIFRSMPNKWMHNDLALIHRSINAVKDYVEKEEKY